jgi:DNA-binding response OmpR family regulator
MNVSAHPAVLVVEPDATSRVRTANILAAAGFHVRTTDAFAPARRAISSEPPAVLVTTLKLGEYNGLHLVLRAKATAPRTATLVTVSASDDGFKKDVQQIGATLITNPITSGDLVAAVLRTLFRTDATVAIEPPFERRVAERRQTDIAPGAERRAGDRRRTLETLLQLAPAG